MTLGSHIQVTQRQPSQPLVSPLGRQKSLLLICTDEFTPYARPDEGKNG